MMFKLFSFQVYSLSLLICLSTPLSAADPEVEENRTALHSVERLIEVGPLSGKDRRKAITKANKNLRKKKSLRGSLFKLARSGRYEDMVFLAAGFLLSNQKDKARDWYHMACMTASFSGKYVKRLDGVDVPLARIFLMQESLRKHRFLAPQVLALIGGEKSLLALEGVSTRQILQRLSFAIEVAENNYPPDEKEVYRKLVSTWGASLRMHTLGGEEGIPNLSHCLTRSAKNTKLFWDFVVDLQTYSTQQVAKQDLYLTGLGFMTESFEDALFGRNFNGRVKEAVRIFSKLTDFPLASYWLGKLYRDCLHLRDEDDERGFVEKVDAFFEEAMTIGPAHKHYPEIAKARADYRLAHPEVFPWTVELMDEIAEIYLSYGGENRIFDLAQSISVGKQQQNHEPEVKEDLCIRLCESIPDHLHAQIIWFGSKINIAQRNGNFLQIRDELIEQGKKILDREEELDGSFRPLLVPLKGIYSILLLWAAEDRGEAPPQEALNLLESVETAEGLCMAGCTYLKLDEYEESAKSCFERSGSPEALFRLAALYMGNEHIIEPELIGHDREVRIFELLLQARAAGYVFTEEEENLFQVISILALWGDVDEEDIDDGGEGTADTDASTSSDGDVQGFEEDIGVSSSSPPAPHLSKKERKLEKKRETAKRHAAAIRSQWESERSDIASQVAAFSAPQSSPWTVVGRKGQPYEGNLELVRDILVQPWGLQGIGSPEILRGYHKSHGAAVYTRRINQRDRLVYVLDSQSQRVVVLQDEGHYGADYDLAHILRRYQEQHGS